MFEKELMNEIKRMMKVHIIREWMVLFLVPIVFGSLFMALRVSSKHVLPVVWMSFDGK